jgi:hypothetical protein
MIRQCARCLIILGEKPPYSDTSISHTECDKCFEEQMKKIEEFHKRQKDKKVA